MTSCDKEASCNGSAIRKSVTQEKYETANILIKMCLNNIEYYKNDKSFVGTKMCLSFEKLKEFLDKSVPIIREIESFAHLYDYDENTPGNGYRSFIFIYESALNYSLKNCQYVNDNRSSLLFRKSLYLKEIEVCSQLIESLFQICSDLIKMHKNSENGNLYSHEYTYDNLITRGAKVINQTCFYGRAVGFQYVDSLKSLLKFLSVTLACFSEAYFSNAFRFMKTTNYFLKHPSYFLDPEMCARRIINVSHNADVRFCKSFWEMGESKLLHALPRLVGYKVEVNRVFKIPPEPIQIYSEKFMKMIDIPVPHSHIGKEPVSCRLLCTRRRKGMVGEKLAELTLPEPSKYLIIHTHGGGWLATSSKSHEFYLREWASRLDVPILSIDYHLCPEAPFPRGLEDVFYTYCWILQNAELLGTTAENIVLCGDSAGANLNTACIIKCIEMGVKMPKGIFDAYSPFLVEFASSPARYMTLLDPLVPFGFIMRIFKTYGASKPINDDSESSEVEEAKEHETVTDVQDDKDSAVIPSSESTKTLEAIWLKVKNSNETNLNWQTNLNSIDELSPEEPISPLVYRSDSLIEPDVLASLDDDDDDVIGMKIDRKNELKDVEEEEALVEESVVEKSAINSSDSNDQPSPRARYVPSRSLSEDNIGVVDIGIEALSLEGLQPSIKKVIPAANDDNNNIEKHTETLKRNYAFSEKKSTESDGIPKAADDEFVFTVPKNHLMSPYRAPDDILRQFPKIKIVTALVDPCIDDCIEFAKKLRSLDVDIELDIVGALNHGFLNFAHISKECHDASMLCLKRIAELLEVEVNTE